MSRDDAHGSLWPSSYYVLEAASATASKLKTHYISIRSHSVAPQNHDGVEDNQADRVWRIMPAEFSAENAYFKEAA